MADQWDEKAEVLLPCQKNCAPVVQSNFQVDMSPIKNHTIDCPIFYRPAVAAELRASYLRGLEAAINIEHQRVREGWDGTATMLWNAIQSRIDALKTEKK